MSLKKGIFFTFITQFPIAITGIITGIFITRVLGPLGKGVHAVFQADVNLLALLLSFNVGFAINYFISSQKLKIPKMIGFGLLSILTTSLILFVALLIIYTLFYDSNVLFPSGYNAKFYYLYIFVSVLLSIVNVSISSIFQGLKKFRVINQIAIFNGVINIIIFGLYFFYRKEVEVEIILKRILQLSLVVQCLNTGIWLIKYFIEVKLMPTFDISWKEIVMIVSFVAIGFLSNLFNFLNYRFDIWVLEAYRSKEELGLYSLAVNTAQILWMITIPIVSVLAPYLNDPTEQRKIERITLFSRINFTALVLLGIVIFLIADFIIPFVYGEAFTGAAISLRILLPGIVISSITKVFALWAIYNNKLKYNLYTTAIGMVFTVLLDLFLIPIYGIIGASAATTCVYIIIFVTHYYLLNKKLSFPFRNYYIITIKDINAFKKILNK